MSEWRTAWRDWGVVLELAFDDLDAWQRFRDNPVVLDSLSAVPDPVHGLHLHRGWDGTGGVTVPRRPRPVVGSGAAALPVPKPLPEALAEVVRPRLLEPVESPDLDDGRVVPLRR